MATFSLSPAQLGFPRRSRSRAIMFPAWDGGVRPQTSHFQHQKAALQGGHPQAAEGVAWKLLKCQLQVCGEDPS